MRDVPVIKICLSQFDKASRLGPCMEYREKNRLISVSVEREHLHTACIACFLSGLLSEEMKKGGESRLYRFLTQSEWDQCFPVKTGFVQDCGPNVQRVMLIFNRDRGISLLHLALKFGSDPLSCDRDSVFTNIKKKQMQPKTIPSKNFFGQ